MAVQVERTNHMNQLILESNHLFDLQLLLSLARRLEVKVAAVSDSLAAWEDKLGLMKQAAHDAQFLADVVAVQEDFKYINAEIDEQI